MPVATATGIELHWGKRSAPAARWSGRRGPPRPVMYAADAARPGRAVRCRVGLACRARARTGLEGKDVRIDREIDPISVVIAEREAPGARRSREAALIARVWEQRIDAIVKVRSAEDAIERVADACQVVEVAEIGTEIP